VAINPKSVIVDTGFWYALFNKRDGNFDNAREKADYVESLTVIIPWPTLYETLNTRLMKNQVNVAAFERRLKQPNVKIIDDVEYRQKALEAALQSARFRKRPISLCDMVIRLIVEDVNVRVDALLTFNYGDFSDVCRIRGVEVL
jgi:predicted nucleic acid-binding protein